MAPMYRGTCIGLILSIIVACGGCGSDVDRPVVYKIQTNDYEVEFDGQQKKATIAVGAFLIVRIPEDIRVVDGMLQVGPRDYGAVRLKDKISVVGGKVAVNGRERTPSGS
jgi:hypothetical protein